MARRYSQLFGEVGAKTGTGGEWSKKDARHANTAPHEGMRRSALCAPWLIMGPCKLPVSPNDEPGRALGRLEGGGGGTPKGVSLLDPCWRACERQSPPGQANGGGGGVTMRWVVGFAWGVQISSREETHVLLLARQRTQGKPGSQAWDASCLMYKMARALEEGREEERNTADKTAADTQQCICWIPIPRSCALSPQFHSPGLEDGC